MEAQIDVQHSSHTKKITRYIVGAVAVVVIIALIVVGGWQYSTYRQNTQRAAASAEYELLLKQVTADEQDESLATAMKLREHYAKTPYATLAALFMAKVYIEQGKLTQAQTALEWAAQHNKTAALDGLIAVRLARVLIAEKQFKQAISLLAKAPSNKQYQGMYDYVLAGAYRAEGNITQARSYYQKAEQQLTNDAALQSIVQMKINNLPVQAEVKK